MPPLYKTSRKYDSGLREYARFLDSALGSHSTDGIRTEGGIMEEVTYRNAALELLRIFPKLIGEFKNLKR